MACRQTANWRFVQHPVIIEGDGWRIMQIGDDRPMPDGLPQSKCAALFLSGDNQRTDIEDVVSVKQVAGGVEEGLGVLKPDAASLVAGKWRLEQAVLRRRPLTPLAPRLF
ncbi:xanthine dehydrogenase family protein [Striga asiatica]|uniref:Xanthine dehydrogenase family protein n=1 Tax=Striga asiatica TaxID=4170 RepID=A0A5A7QUM0_STRAF|nr:xanthine dehydrogenase family protein [Striga asiatica]